MMALTSFRVEPLPLGCELVGIGKITSPITRLQQKRPNRQHASQFTFLQSSDLTADKAGELLWVDVQFNAQSQVGFANSGSGMSALPPKADMLSVENNVR
jgi:hypothetical protein